MTDKTKTTVSTLRREKSANYTRDEKHLLLDKVTPFLDIIENKKTDTVTIEAKTRAWAQVTSNYNAANPRGLRKTNQLKNLYENLKKRVKKDLLNDKQEFRRIEDRNPVNRFDEIGWRLIKLLPRFKQLYVNSDSTEDTNNKRIFLVERKIKTNALTEVRNIEQGHLNIKEEILHDVTVGLDQLPDDYCSEDYISLDTNEELITDLGDSAAEIYSRTMQTVATQTDELFDIQKEMKRKEIEKLNLDIQLKQLEVEHMKAKLREQEIHVKFKEMEYHIKYKEII